MSLIRKIHRIIISSALFMMIGLIGATSKAFIPSAKYILERTAVNLSAAPVYIEKDIVITNSLGTVNLRELWLIESDSDVKVIVQGAKDLKDKLQFSINYNAKSRHSGLNAYKSEPLSAEFYEPLFFQEDKTDLANFLINHGILPTQFNSSKNFSKPSAKYFSYTPEPFLKLSRAGGKVSYFLFNGQAELNPPGIWIEQDFFNIQKIRTEQGSTIAFEDLANYGKKIHLPKMTSIAWASNLAQQVVIEAKAAKPQHQVIFKNSADFQKEEFLNSPMRSSVEEFYLRFR